jgi:hypothetical protein
MKTLFTLFAVLAISASTLFAQSGQFLPRQAGTGILLVGQAPVNGTNEIQTLTIGGTPTAGSFTLTFEGRTTAAIQWSNVNATLLANIDNALEALSTVGTGGVTTAAGTLTAGIGTITVTFTGNLAKLDVPQMTFVNSMTGTSPTLANATTTAGVTADGRTKPTGTLLIDQVNGKLYINTSATSLNPTWTVVGTQS